MVIFHLPLLDQDHKAAEKMEKLLWDLKEKEKKKLCDDWNGNYVCATAWEEENSSSTQILREINFKDSRSSKTAIFAVLEPMNFTFGKFQPSKIEKSSKI